jgi:hypothetical protein
MKLTLIVAVQPAVVALLEKYALSMTDAIARIAWMEFAVSFAKILSEFSNDPY